MFSDHSDIAQKVDGNAASSPSTQQRQKQMLSVSGKKKCSNCGDDLGRYKTAEMVGESLFQQKK